MSLGGPLSPRWRPSRRDQHAGPSSPTIVSQPKQGVSEHNYNLSLSIYIYIYIYIYSVLLHLLLLHIRTTVLFSGCKPGARAAADSKVHARSNSTEYSDAVRPISLLTKIIPIEIRRLEISGEFPMDMRIPHLENQDSA